MNYTQLFNSDESFASTILIAVADKFGDSIFSSDYGVWDIATFRSEIKAAFGVEINEYGMGKLLAAISVITSDAMRTSLPSFLMIVHGLLGDGTDWYAGEPIDVEDLAWAVTEASLLWPVSSDIPFNPQIVGYTRTLLDREGIIFPPAALVFAEGPTEEEGYFSQDDDLILADQMDRTQAVNGYVESELDRLVDQISELADAMDISIDFLEPLLAEIVEVASKDKWL